MFRHVARVGAGVLLWAVLLSTGCTEVYLLFGPGAIFGPQSYSVAGGGTTSRSTVIPAPIYVTDQADPVLEATAGAKVVVAAQLNDDNGDGVIDGNDWIDFVSGSDESQPVQIHLNQGGGRSFRTLTVAGGGPIARLIDIKVADLDLDGRPDLAVLVNDTGFTPVQGAKLRGAVVLVFAPPDPTDALSWSTVTIAQPFVLPCDGTGMTGFDVADFDLDGLPDLALGSNEEGDVEKYIRLYRNPGPPVGAEVRDLKYRNNWTASVITIDAVPFRSLKAADIDGDGDLDVVATFPTAKTYNTRWLINPAIPNGAAAVGNPWARKVVGQQQDGGDFLDVADIDGDGDPDVVVAKVAEGLVQWFENPDRPADGVNVVAQQNFPWNVYNLGRFQTGYTIEGLQLVDLDNNGTVDCFATAGGNLVGFQRGLQLYDWWQAFVIASVNPVARVGRCAFVDLNGDALIDIVAPLDRDGLTQDQILIFTRLTR